MAKMLYGATWTPTGPGDLMTDEMGHKRHRDNVPCFLGGSRHSHSPLGNDIVHGVLRGVWACVYCGRGKNTRPITDPVILEALGG